MTARWFLPLPPPADEPASLAAFRAAWLAETSAIDPGRACGCPPEGCQGHRTRPDTAGILAALSEPLGLPGASLPAYGVPGDGCCRECLRPPVHSQGLCVYCHELARARGETDVCEHGLPRALCRARRAALDDDYPSLARVAVLLLLLTFALAAVLWATGVLT